MADDTDAKAGAGRDGDKLEGGTPEQDGTPVGILFVAAAAGLFAILMVVGLVAYFAMGR